MSDTVIAADLGGTNLRMAVVDRDGSILHRSRRDTQRDAASGVIVDGIVSEVEGCLAAAAGRKVLGVSIAAPGPVDFASGILKKLPNLSSLSGLPLPKILSERLGVNVFLDNDATAAAVGEHWLGATRGTDSSIFVTLGTGVGGGLILDGKPYRGIDGTAGEIGHIGVEKDGHPCGCGSRGCVEQYASATAIVRIAKELASGHPNSPLRRIEELSASDIYDAGVGSDSLALEVFSVMGAYLGMALADLVNVLNPEMIVIGGGVAGAWDLFIGPTMEAISKRSFREPAERVKLIRAALGDDAGILGAARLAFSATS
jgi:glucokinase